MVILHIPIRNTHLAFWLPHDCLVLFVQQLFITSHGIPFISAQLPQISAPPKRSPKPPPSSYPLWHTSLLLRFPTSTEAAESRASCLLFCQTNPSRTLHCLVPPQGSRSRIKMELLILGRTLGFHELDLAQSLTPEESYVAV